MKKFLAVVELIRVKHWVKNVLIFLPAVCARRFELDVFITLCLGFFAFSFMTSFIYIVNDVRDIEKDRMHPRKKKRPLPSGRISKKVAIVLAVLMFMVSLVLQYFASGEVFGLSLMFLATYAIINLGYSFGLKNVAIIDVALLSAGFILRIYYGAALVDVVVSSWLFLTILSASVFLALGKRKKELAANGAAVRKVLNKYNLEFLDRFTAVFLAGIFIFYSLWAIEQENNYLTMTIPLVMMIFMKYCLDIEKSDEGDPTTIIYSDKILLGLAMLYIVIVGVIFAFL